MIQRRLVGSDAAALKSFKCAVYRAPWTQDVEEAITAGLPGRIAGGHLDGLGMLDGDLLIGVAAWSETAPRVWRNHILAVLHGHHRHGHGLELKKAVLAEARLHDCLLVISLVHVDNTAMLRINQKLGAELHLDPEDPYRNTMICTISI